MRSLTQPRARQPRSRTRSDPRPPDRFPPTSQHRKAATQVMPPQRQGSMLRKEETERPKPNGEKGPPRPNDSTSSAWKTWLRVSIKIDNLPLDVTTQDLWEWFSPYGEIYWLEIFGPQRNTMSAKVCFEPPPQHAFWTGDFLIKTRDQHKYPRDLSLRITLVQESQLGSQYPTRIIATSHSLHWGAMVGPTTMNIRKALASTADNDIKLELDTSAECLAVYFSLPNEKKQAQQFKFVANLSQIKTSFHAAGDEGDIFVVPLLMPPQYFRKSDDILQSLSKTSTRWSIQDTWYRATDVVCDFNIPLHYPVAANNDIPDTGYIEVGRWTSFRLCLKSSSEAERRSIQQLKSALEDFNVKFQESKNLRFTRTRETMWDYIDRPPLYEEDSAAALLQMPKSSVIHLDFSVRYQLEVCASRGVLNEHTVSVEFLEKLAALNPVDATRRLEYLVDQGQVLFDPMQLFNFSKAQYYLPNARIPSYCTLVQRANVTPTTIRFSSPVVETSNRVVRHYRHIQDRFLRVQFIEESEMGRLGIKSQQNDEIWRRVTRTLYRGIRIGDRTYEFLAFGNSQMRQAGVYFFCPTEHTSCDDIRQWMGEVGHIKVVAKYAARLGQCFSTTREMRGMPVPHVKSIPDVETDDGDCFTDGVGIISGFLARLVMEEMALDVYNEPSAFQFRMSGCKGVLAVWPQAKGQEVYIRPSQEKFKADTKNLEIIRCAKFANASLNRQTITILECLGVPRQVFEDLLDHQIQLHEKAMTNNSIAVEMLTKCVDEKQSTIILAELLQAGFKTETLQEPFVMNLLKLWRSWSLKQLKEKSRIQVEKSAFVLGCVDETGTLRGHSRGTEGSKIKNENLLPQIFLQISDTKKYNHTKIIQGICIVGRNPSLHPGDIRVVQAVDNPKLRHLKDVVVFPSTGDRPVQSMLSGGDLDGDDFFIIWDPRLIPNEWNFPPMNYTAEKVLELNRDVNMDDLRDFFVNYLKNDALPLIATAHLAFADSCGPKSPICLKLALLHSKAVDYPKTGEPAEYGPKYQPRKWPHFMEKKSIYRSNKALGRIYDKVEKQDVRFSPDWGRAFDQRIISRFKELDPAILNEARKIKAQYDIAVRRILAQHNVETEFELYTTWAMSKPRIGTDYKRQEDLGFEYDVLKQRFQEICYEAARGYDETKIDRFVAAIYKVTEEEMKAALDEHDCGSVDDEGTPVLPRQLEASSMPLMSLPWIFPWVMTRIASGGKYNPKKSVLAAAHRMSMPIAQTGSSKSADDVAGDTKSKIAENSVTDLSDPADGESPEKSPGKENGVIIEDALEREDLKLESSANDAQQISIEHAPKINGVMDRLSLFEDD